MNYYLYQFTNLLPQLLVVQIVALLFDSEAALLFAKSFAFINILSILIDWGASSIGAKYICNELNQYKKNSYYISYEAVRLFIFIVVASLYFSLVYFNFFERNFELNLAVCLGLFSALIFPNWINLGGDFDKKLIVEMAVYRLAGLLLIIGLSFEYNESKKIAIYYYLYSGIGAIYFRMNSIDFLTKFNEPSLPEVRRVLLNGAAFTTGSFLSSCITGPGSILILNYFESKSFIEFLIAERLIAVGRVILGLMFQKDFIKSKSGKDRIILKSYVIYYGAFLLLFFITFVFVGNAVYGGNFSVYFTILFLGYSLSGFSHVYVTQNLLGNEKYADWIRVLLIAVCAYIFMIFFLKIIKISDGSLVASISTMFAEVAIFLYGFLKRGKL
jgi:hypothetical protein